MLLDSSPSAHRAKANTQEKRVGRVEIRFIQGLSLKRWTGLLSSKHHLGELKGTKEIL